MLKRLAWLAWKERKEAVQEVITQWLDGQELEDKLSALPTPSETPASGGLFSTINRDIKAEAPVESQVPGEASQARQTLEALRAYYQQPDFAQVPSLFPGKPGHRAAPP